MSRLPSVESVYEHGGGDWARIAAWVFDCLDREPPPPGSYLALYFCYHSNDRTYFNSPRRDQELSDALLEVYEKESQECLRERLSGAPGFGDLCFALRAASPPAHLCFTPGGGQGTSTAGERGSKGSNLETLVELCWDETTSQIAPGTLGLVRRWVKPFEPRQMLIATLTVLGGATITVHTDRWQRAVRWQQPVVYLPPGRTEILIGASAGCDLRAPALPLPMLVTYDSEADSWEWLSPSAPWVGGGRSRGGFKFKYEGEGESPPLEVRGARLKKLRTWEAQNEENYLPSFTLEIVGCLLPLPQYGTIPEDLPAALLSSASSALQLPGGDWLYLHAQTGEPHLWQRGAGQAGRRLKETRVAERLTARPGTSGVQMATWADAGGLLSRFFRGELHFITPLVSRLAIGAIAEDLPHDLFTGYADRAVGRSPLRLKSADGLRYALSFNANAQHPVFLLNPDSSAARTYQPHPETIIDLGAGADFICGTTHYRLRRASHAGLRREKIIPTIVSAGGVS